MTKTSNQQIISSPTIDAIADEIYSYFKENNARMTVVDAIHYFEKYSVEDVVEAFEQAVCYRGMQQTGVNESQKDDTGGFTPEIYGYSKDGRSLKDEGYWVRGPLKITQKGFARIPTQMFKGFLESQPKREDIINDMICFAIYDRSLYCKSAKEASDFLNIDSKNPDRSAEYGKRISKSIRTHSYYYLQLSKLFDIRDNRNCTNEQASLFLMYYALGSIKGTRDYQKTNNSFMLSRMDGNDSLVPPEEWSWEIRNISTRSKLDRLKRLVKEYYKVTFYGAHMRGFIFSMKYNDEELMMLLATTSHWGKEKALKHEKKEKKTQAQEMEDTLKWLQFRGLSVEAVKKMVEDNKTKREQKNY